MTPDEIILEDNDLIVFAPSKALVQGQIILAAKGEQIILEQVSDSLIEKMFQVANKLSSTLFESLQCHGTNILVQNGVAAGQTEKAFMISVIPRFEKDSLNFEWQPKQADPESLKKTAARFTDAENEEKNKKFLLTQKAKAENTSKTPEITSSDDNYMVQSLTRLP